MFSREFHPNRPLGTHECFVMSWMVGYPESAGINRHVVGDEEPYGKEVANPSWPRVLQATSRGVGLKRRQRYRWAGLLSFEKPLVQDADSVPSGGRQHDSHVIREWLSVLRSLRTRAR